MKKLVTMVAILGVLAFCLPSYGEILIYKVAVSGKAIDWDDEELESGTQSGYLVIDSADSGYIDVDGMALILYGKQDDGYKAQFYFVHDYGDSWIYDGYDWYDLSPGEPMYIDIDLYSDYENSTVLEGEIIGQFKNTNIGDTDGKWLIPTSLNGTGVLWYDMFNGDNLDGYGTIALRLQEGWTQTANKNGDSLDDTVDYITGVLSALGYDDWGNEADW
jgi:hypothetical protein